MRFGLSALIICVLVCPVTAQVVYQTGFESPTFVNGNLLGQDLWQSTNDPATPNRAVIQNSVAQSGTRSVRIDASVSTATDYFWRDLSFGVQTATAPIVQISWNMYLDGAGSTKSVMWGIEVFDNSSPLPRRVTAIAVNQSGILQVWNGLTFFNTGVTVTRDAWHAFRVNMNYAAGARKVSVYLDNTRVAVNLAFGPSTTDTVADADLWNLDGGGNDKAYFDNYSVVALADSDGDGVPDADDDCPGTAPAAPVDGAGCSTLDDDSDGVFNDVDSCPGTPICASNILSNGCPVDTDGDTVVDGCDNCNTIPNGPGQGNQSDVDGDGLGDICDPCPNRKAGDVSGDGNVDGRDLQRYTLILAGATPTADELCAADLDDDNAVDDDDTPLLIDILFGN